MSIGAMNWVKGMNKSRIKSGPRTVLREMADFADEIDECWPSVETLSNCTSLSQRAVQEGLRVLEAMGLISTFQRFRRSSRYRLNRHLDLSSPLKGAESAPSRRRVEGSLKVSRSPHDLSNSPPEKDAKGAESAPLIVRQKSPVKGADSVVPRVQILQVWGAPAAPKPPKNHHRTLREGGVRARATPLPRSWQPSEEDAAYARQLGLDPAVLAPRFRRQFAASGRAYVNWSARWEIWCDEDAAKVPPAANATASPLPRPLPPASAAIPVDPDGLDAAARSWVVNWETKRAAGEELSGFEGAMHSYARGAFVVVQRLKLASAVRPKPRLAFSNAG